MLESRSGIWDFCIRDSGFVNWFPVIWVRIKGWLFEIGIEFGFGFEFGFLVSGIWDFWNLNWFNCCFAGFDLL